MGKTHMDSWIPAISALTGALIALGGVLLTARATDRREREKRLWERQAEVFVEVLTWLHTLGSKPPFGPSRRVPAHADHYARFDELAAKMAVYADHELQQAFYSAANSIPIYRDGRFEREGYEQPVEYKWRGTYEFERLVRERLGYTDRDSIPVPEWARKPRWYEFRRKRRESQFQSTLPARTSSED